MKKNGFKIDTTNFNSAVREMSKLTGLDVKDILRSEVESILSQTLKNTNAASVDKIRKYYIASTTKSGKARYITMDQKIYNLTHRYPDSLWAKIISLENIKMKEILARRGLAKQSWLAIGDYLGMNLTKVPAYVKKANVYGKKFDQKVSANQTNKSRKSTIFIVNSMLSAIAANGKAALMKAINGRTGYFHRNVRAGVFKKTAVIAKKYPGFKIKGI